MKRDSTVRQFPRARIPISPVLSRHSLRGLKKPSRGCHSILDLDSVLQVSSGRAAIALALEHAGIGYGDEVLIPAFHCESMVSPVTWCHARPAFYQINRDCSIDLQDLASRITAKTRAIVAAHYFGFQQNLDSIRSLCDHRDIILIEDCAHAFFGSGPFGKMGTWGDYAIASSMKFFPVYDGGILASSRRELREINVAPAPLSFQIKSCLNVVETALTYNRLGLAGKLLGGLLGLKSWIWTALKKIFADPNQKVGAPGSSEGGYALEEKWIHVRTSRSSRTIIALADCQHIQQKRRENYQRLLTALSGLPGIKPLLPEVPEGVIPLVFPVYFERPDYYFPALKQRGVPIWRFGEFLDDMVDETTYPATIGLSRHILQFPCHQELRDDELDWMIREITQTLLNTQ